MNRMVRDQILHTGLDMVDNAWLDAHDRPGGPDSPVSDNALAIAWLQQALDRFHREFPWMGAVRTASLLIPPVGFCTVPSDYILDVRDGLIVPAQQTRLYRLASLQAYIRSQVIPPPPAQCPHAYIVQHHTLRVVPVPATGVTATFWYYALPAALDANDVPSFPDDFTLSEYIRLRGLEHCRVLPPGTAQTYCASQITQLKSAGLGGEPEADEIELDRRHFLPGPIDYYGGAWMGPTTAR